MAARGVLEGAGDSLVPGSKVRQQRERETARGGGRRGRGMNSSTVLTRAANRTSHNATARRAPLGPVEYDVYATSSSSGSGPAAVHGGLHIMIHRWDRWWLEHHRVLSF